MLGQFAGWQYAARLAPGFAVGGALRVLWPGHHFGWVVLTVALLCRRQLEVLPVQATQRTLGVVIGVALTWLLVGRTLPTWMLASLVAVLAGLGPWLRAQNYLAYTASVTPLIVVLLSAGGPVEAGMLVDRLVATLIGAALVIVANLVVARFAPPAPADPRAGRERTASPPDPARA
jgi:uncharacterized membrane protein YccC